MGCIIQEIAFCIPTCYTGYMATDTLIIKKIEALEQKFAEFAKPKSILGKMKVDDAVLQQAAKAPFDFDIEKYVSKKDVERWKKR